MAAAAGMLRVVGDQHYVTDVLAGAVVGTAAGFFLPWLLHYRTSGGPAEVEGSTERSRPSSQVRVLFAPTPGGAGVLGAF